MEWLPISDVVDYTEPCIVSYFWYQFTYFLVSSNVPVEEALCQSDVFKDYYDDCVQRWQQPTNVSR